MPRVFANNTINKFLEERPKAGYDKDILTFKIYTHFVNTFFSIQYIYTLGTRTFLKKNLK